MSSNLNRAPRLVRSRLLAYYYGRGRLAVFTIAPPQLNRPRPISTAPLKATKMASPLLKWDNPSPERSIQRLLDAGDINKWGWIVYRTAYQPELDAAWAMLQRLVLENLHESIAESDAPEIADRMDWPFVAGPELEGASLDELKRRFRAWARADAPRGLGPYEPGISRGSRYDFFVQADEEALRSLVPDPGSTHSALLSSAHVNLVRGWVDPRQGEEATDANGEPVDNEDWMKIQLDVISTHYYIELGDDDAWYAYYRAPPDGICMS
ncbi:hypothetical protein B0I35DRAFT_264180 [Stachybotrys elegans]|uniref:Uncharacterized protein n=1 Tax=Stachybotrys elegans TaxID=80388 RepID=A0A8K0WRQ3_9HYPO|nr:hypothetical protein B0I35DRAFT_264180 [Stachybotrys elegans]